MRLRKIIFAIIIIITITAACFWWLYYSSYKPRTLSSYNLLTPVYLSPEMYLDEGDIIYYSISPGIVQEFSPKGFLVAKMENDSEIAYSLIDYNGKTLWSVLSQGEKQSMEDVYAYLYAPHIQLLLDAGKITEATAYAQRNRYSVARLSPKGELCATVTYLKDGLTFSLFKNGAFFVGKIVEIQERFPV